MATAPGGYKMVFITEVSEDWMCIACSLILKKPVQVADCGYCFCESCYEQLRDHSKSSRSFNKFVEYLIKTQHGNTERSILKFSYIYMMRI